MCWSWFQICVPLCVQACVYRNLFHSYVLMLPFLFLCHTSESKHSLVPMDGGSVFFQSWTHRHLYYEKELHTCLFNALLSYPDNNCDDYMHNVCWIQKIFLKVVACFLSSDLILYNLISALLWEKLIGQFSLIPVQVKFNSKIKRKICF